MNSIHKGEKSSNFITILKQEPHSFHNNNHISTLSPYIIQIEKRKKLRKQKDNIKNKFNANNSSSKSFRISQRSTSSLHKLPLQKSKDGISSILSKNIKQNRFKTKQKSNKAQPVSSFSKTLDNRRQKNDSSNQSDYFTDHYLKIKSKQTNETNKEKINFRKNLYETMQTIPRNETKSIQDNCQINIKKISYTNVNIQRNHDSKELDTCKKSTGAKKNYRKNKYQNLHSSVNQKPKNEDMKMEPLHSQRLFSVQTEMNKKQSNVNLNINRQMDILAENQMKIFYRQVRTKELQKSLQKSTQKYFKNQSYRPKTKTKNQIQIYISTVQNPNFAIQKESRSTNDNDKKSQIISSADIIIEKKQQSKTDYYAYDFEFQMPTKQIVKPIHFGHFSLGINQMEFQNSSELNDSSLMQINKEEEFQKQRKIAQIQYFNKGHFKLDWSDDDCQIDDI